MQINNNTKRSSWRCGQTFRLLVISVCLMLFCGCGSNGFQIKNIVRTIAGLVTDMYCHKRNALDDELVITFYKDNPRALAKMSEQTTGILNLGVECVFDKMIATHNMISDIIANRANPALNNTVRSIAQAMFLPV